MKKLIYLAFISLVVLGGCKSAAPEKTIENLKAGIIGETTASAKYAAFAQKANEEGLPAVAKLFEAASKAESIHATNHTKVLEGLNVKMEDFTPQFEVKTTAENLQAAIDGETYEVTTMYPKFLADAKAGKVEKATKSFIWASDTEKKHAEFYKTALESIQSGQAESLPMDYFVCPVCGNTYDGSTVEANCAFCQTGKEKYIAI